MRLIKFGHGCILSMIAVFGSSVLVAQESSKQTVEPIYRLSHKLNSDDVTESSSEENNELAGKNPSFSESETTPKAAPHPLDRALNIAETGLENIRNNVRDYEAILVKRERINDELLDPEFMAIKIRNEHVNNEGKKVPFSIYMNFLKPRAIKGREVIWVEGRNDDKIIAHDPGLKSLVTVHLDPEGNMAMNGNRYPIYEAGIENLVAKLIEKGTRDRAAGMCEVKYIENAKINKRSCTMIQVTHKEQKQPYEFYRARIFIDNELQIPIRYSAYLWPEKPGDQPKLLEEYTYVNVKLNVGLTDKDFDHRNPEYDYR